MTAIAWHELMAYNQFIIMACIPDHRCHTSAASRPSTDRAGSRGRGGEEQDGLTHTFPLGPA